MRIAIIGPMPSQLRAIERAFPDDEIISIRKNDGFTCPSADLYVAWLRFIGHPMGWRLQRMAGTTPFVQSMAGGVSGLVADIREAVTR